MGVAEPMTTNIDRAAACAYGTLSGKYGDFDHHWDVADALAAEGLLMPDLPKPETDEDGWTSWKDSFGTEVEYHPEDGLWIYDDGRMIPVDPDALYDRALRYLAAATYAKEEA